jgi:hypothetical protein
LESCGEIRLHEQLQIWLRDPAQRSGSDVFSVKNEVNNLNSFACFAFPLSLVTKTARD